MLIKFCSSVYKISTDVINVINQNRILLFLSKFNEMWSVMTEMCEKLQVNYITETKINLDSLQENLYFNKIRFTLKRVYDTIEASLGSYLEI